MLALYAAVGPELIWYEADPHGATLARRGGVTLPAEIQYAWPHASRRFLYVASSDRAKGRDGAGTRHFVTAFRVAAGSGELTGHGAVLVLPGRPIHISTDARSDFLLVAFNSPADLRVYRIHEDGSLGAEVSQAGPMRLGIYPHQIRVTPDGRLAILATRGNDAAGAHAEDPGALQVFRVRGGDLTQLADVAPGGGFGFGPRHMDFHPTQPWVYVTMERQNTLEMFRISGEALSPAPAFRVGTLSEPAGPGQRTGAIHVHPNGRFVYVSNRASDAVVLEGRPVFAGGENSVAVFAIAPESGEPTLVESVATGGLHCRSFAIDPSGQMLVAGNMMEMTVRDGTGLRTVPAGLSTFHIGPDGRLSAAQTYDAPTAGRFLFWVGMIAV